MRPTDASLDRTFSALSDATRRAILGRLMHGEASVSALVAPFQLSQPTLSKHLKVLTTAGLVEQRRDGKFRPCRLHAERLEEAWSWLGDYRGFWEQSYDRLDVVAKALHAREKEEKAHGRKKGRRPRSGA